MRYLFLRYPEGKLKAVTFSYDDGCRDDIRLAQIFTKYNLKGTFNLNSKWLGKSKTDWHLMKEEIQEHIVNAGHEIATHGAEHRANGNLRTIDGIQDVLNCRLGLEKDFDTIVRGLAYPDTGITQLTNGSTLDSIEHYLKELDIVYARTLGAVNPSFALPQNWYRWMPTIWAAEILREANVPKCPKGWKALAALIRMPSKEQCPKAKIFPSGARVKCRRCPRGWNCLREWNCPKA